MAIVDLFFEAVERNDVEGVRALLKKRRYLLSILKNDGSNCNAFHIAAKRGHVEMMNLLLVSLPDEKHHFSQGRLPHNRPDLSYHTPLSYAARYGHAVIVGQLRHAGAVYKVFNQNSPLGLAAQYGHVDIVRQLLVALEPGNFFLSMMGEVKLDPRLSQMLAREVVEDKTGALWLAMYDDNADVVSVLLEAGCEASVGILLAKLFIAEERRVIPEKRLSIIHQLLTANAENVNREIPEPELLRQCTLIRDSHRRPAPGGTLLHAIASLGHDALVRILLEHGADPTRRNTAGETPRDVAMRCQHISVVQIFDEARRSVRPLQDLCFFRARAAVAAGEIPTEEAAAKLTPSLARGVCSRLTH